MSAEFDGKGDRQERFDLHYFSLGGIGRTGEELGNALEPMSPILSDSKGRCTQ
jgi:hypothetical protein